MSTRVTVVGEGSKDLVLVHGWGFCGEIWRESLVNIGPDYRVHLVDMPGYAGSPYPGSDHHLSGLGAGITTAVPGGAVWLGWSLGGMVAMQAAVDSPGAIAGLCLVGTSPRFVVDKGWPNALLPNVLDEFSKVLNIDLVKALSRFAALVALGGSSQRKTNRRLHNFLLSNRIPDERTLSDGLNLLRDSDLRKQLPKIRCPVLAIYSERDALIPVETASVLERCCPSWRVRTLLESGHAPFISQPQQFWHLVHTFADGVLKRV